MERAKALADKECPAFYRMLIVIATTFLGGTLAFIEKIVPHPLPGSIWILGAGWTLLVGTILCVVWVRWCNIEALHAYLRGRYDRSDRLQVVGRSLMVIAGTGLGVGMFCVMMFGFVNFRASTAAVPVQESSDGPVPGSSASPR